MRHGRDNQNRESQADPKRANNTPDRYSLEAQLRESGRKRAEPGRGLVGAHLQRSASNLRSDEVQTELDEEEPVGQGSDVAPTRRAEQREMERHRREQELGHFAAGIAERRRAHTEKKVTREELERAAQAADRKVTKGKVKSDK